MTVVFASEIEFVKECAVDFSFSTTFAPEFVDFKVVGHCVSFSVGVCGDCIKGKVRLSIKKRTGDGDFGVCVFWLVGPID